MNKEPQSMIINLEKLWYYTILSIVTFVRLSILIVT